MSFCSLTRSETISSQHRPHSSGENTSQQIISHQQQTAEHNFNNRMYQEASAHNDLLRSNGSQEVTSGRSNFQSSLNVQLSGNYQPSGTAFPGKVPASTTAICSSSCKLQASTTAFSSSSSNLQASTTNFLSSSKLDAGSSRRRLEEFNEKLRVLNKEVSEKRIEAAVMSVEEALSISTRWMEKMQKATNVMNACRAEIEGSNFVVESSEMEI